MAEHKTAVQMASLPVQFFDLRYSALDLESTFDSWYANLEPDIAALTGISPPTRPESSCSWKKKSDSNLNRGTISRGRQRPNPVRDIDPIMLEHKSDV